MGFTFVNELPTPDMIREQFPLAPNLAEAKLQRDEEIKNVLTGESDKFIVLIGPCSADNEDSVGGLYVQAGQGSGKNKRPSDHYSQSLHQ